MNESKYIKISLLASLLTMLPALILFFFATVNGASILANGEVDNDPMRAGGALLFLSPLMYLAIFLFYCTTSRLLAWLGKLTIKYLEILVFIVSAFLAYSLAYDDFLIFVINFFVFSIWLSIGSFAWFYFGILPYNKALKSLAGTRSDAQNPRAV